MDTLVDDVGSFPLHHYVDRRFFNEAYVHARDAIIDGKDFRKDEFLFNSFYRVIIDSFKKKFDTGLDVVNYPQHYDMHSQFMDVIHKAMDKGTYVVDEKQAIMPEVHVINYEAKRICEETGKRFCFAYVLQGPWNYI